YVGRPLERGAGQGDDAMDQRPAQHDGIVHRQRGAHVLAEHADVRREPAAGYLTAGQDLDQLLLAPRRVFGGYLDNADRFALGRSAHRGDRLGLVVLDADQYPFGVENVAKYLNAGDDLRCVMAHAHVVGGDVGLALRGVDHQRVDAVVRARQQLGCRRKAGPAQAADAGGVDQVQQRDRFQAAPAGGRLQLCPAVLAVAVENDRRLVQAGCVGVGRVLDGADDPGCRRMQRAAEFAIGNGQQLPLEYSVAGIHHRLGSTADMLQQREDQARGQRWVFQPAGGGLDLVLGWVNATGDIPDTRLGGHQDTPRWSATSVGGGGAIQPQFWVVTGKIGRA